MHAKKRNKTHHERHPTPPQRRNIDTPNLFQHHLGKTHYSIRKAAKTFFWEKVIFHAKPKGYQKKHINKKAYTHINTQ